MTTRKKDLRTGREVWRDFPAPRVAAHKLRRDEKADVLVIGAGVSGALTADALVRAGFDVLVADRRRVAAGSTSASTSLVQYEIDTPLTALARKIGRERAARAWLRSRLAVDALFQRTRHLGIRCDLVRAASLFLAGDELDGEGLAREHAARRRIGLECDLLDRRALAESYGLDRPAAILSHENVAADPRRLTAGYLRTAIAGGARYVAPLEIVDVAETRRRAVATAADGRTIEAAYVVYATGYEIPAIVRTRRHRIVSTYALATRPLRRRPWREELLVWEASEPYLYLRTTADGRLVVGGEDEDFADADARDALIPAKVDAIRRKLKVLLPEIDTLPAYAWAGAFGASTTGLPSIGFVPGWSRVLALMGYGGNGITFSRIGADLVASLIEGSPDPDADLFAFEG